MTAEALLTTRNVEIIRKKNFAEATLDADNEIFVIHIAALDELTFMLILPFCKAQIALLINMEISIKYFNFLDVFSSDFAA